MSDAVQIPIRLRRGTTAQWNAADTASVSDSSRLLGDGEPGLNTDTDELKIGDGVSKFADLPPYVNKTGVTGIVTAQAPSLAAATTALDRPSVLNRAKLTRFAAALALTTRPAVITVLGNSISYGVGCDGATSTTTGFYEAYRQNSWPAQLRRLLAARGGWQPADDFVHPGSYYGVTTNLVGTAVRDPKSASWGTMAGGAISLPDATAKADFASANMGAFTSGVVYYWGTTAGLPGYSPRVLIDDVEVHAGGFLSSGNIGKVTFSGLTDAKHKITVQGVAAGGSMVFGVGLRRSTTGIIVNKVAMPGGTAAAVPGDGSFTTAEHLRNYDAGIMYGQSDLVIVCFTANEVYNQHALSAYQTVVQAITDRAVNGGASVLLMADPAVNNEETAYAIKGSQYRAILQSISNASTHVAYADFNAVFGDRANAVMAGMFEAGGSVHPYLEGHRRMADFLIRDVLPGPAV